MREVQRGEINFGDGEMREMSYRRVTRALARIVTRREFWLCGEPNELDAGVWYDHHPGVDVIYGKEFHRYHVREIIPGEIQLTKGELRAAWARAFNNSSAAPPEQLENELFGGGVVE